MFRSKKKAELSINTIVIIIILIVVLVVVLLIFTGGMKSIGSSLWSTIKSALDIFKSPNMKPLQ